jgi:hypothetical protein
MKRIPKPSPAMVVALAAVVIGLSGVAVATIPDSSGTIHSCAHKQSGAMRAVESPNDCRANERLVSWSQGGETGVRVVARMRSEHPVTVSGEEGAQIPLSGDTTWVQNAGEFQEVHQQVVQEGSTCVGQGVIRIANPLPNLPAGQSFDVIPNPDRTVQVVGTRHLGVPDEPVEHSLSIEVRKQSFCDPGESVTIESVDVVVVAFG